MTFSTAELVIFVIGWVLTLTLFWYVGAVYGRRIGQGESVGIREEANARVDKDAGAFMQIFDELVNARQHPELRIVFARTRVDKREETNGRLAIIVRANLADFMSDPREIQTSIAYLAECYHTIVVLDRGADRLIKMMKEFAKRAQSADVDGNAVAKENRRLIEL